MIFPYASDYLLDQLKKKAEEAVENRMPETVFIREITAYLRRVENSVQGFGNDAISNYDAFALFLGKACSTYGHLDAFRRLKEGILHEK